MSTRPRGIYSFFVIPLIARNDSLKTLRILKIDIRSLYMGDQKPYNAGNLAMVNMLPAIKKKLRRGRVPGSEGFREPREVGGGAGSPAKMTSELQAEPGSEPLVG